MAPEPAVAAAVLAGMKGAPFRTALIACATRSATGVLYEAPSYSAWIDGVHPGVMRSFLNLCCRRALDPGDTIDVGAPWSLHLGVGPEYDPWAEIGQADLSLVATADAPAPGGRQRPIVVIRSPKCVITGQTDASAFALPDSFGRAYWSWVEDLASQPEPACGGDPAVRLNVVRLPAVARVSPTEEARQWRAAARGAFRRRCDAHAADLPWPIAELAASLDQFTEFLAPQAGMSPERLKIEQGLLKLHLSRLQVVEA